MKSDQTRLTNEELAKWVISELQKYDRRDKEERTQVVQGKSSADARDQEVPRLRAVIAGQQALLRDLPNLALTGEFSAVPATEGGWTVRYAVRDANGFGRAPSGVVECFVAANGTVDVLRGPRRDDLSIQSRNNNPAPIKLKRTRQEK